MPGNGKPTQRPSADIARRREVARPTVGPTSLWPYSWRWNGRRRRDPPRIFRTVRGWMASNVLLSATTLDSGPRGSSASGSHSTNVLGWASSTPGLTSAKMSAIRSGVASLVMTIGKPRLSAMASAVTSRECTNDTRTARVSRPRISSRAPSACGR